jgi:hypothetical protein
VEFGICEMSEMEEEVTLAQNGEVANLDLIHGL